MIDACKMGLVIGKEGALLLEPFQRVCLRRTVDIALKMPKIMPSTS